jgi:hypothetical protein
MNQAESAHIELQATDVDGDNLMYLLIDQPQYGRLSGAAPNLEYHPPITFSGTDQFSYVVSDGILESNEATVLIQVLPLEDPAILVPHIIRTEVVGNHARITWTSWIGGIYRIRQRPSLASPDWEPVLEEIEAVSQLSTTEIPISPGVSESYYSVELVR